MHGIMGLSSYTNVQTHDCHYSDIIAVRLPRGCYMKAVHAINPSARRRTCLIEKLLSLLRQGGAVCCMLLHHTLHLFVTSLQLLLQLCNLQQTQRMCNSWNENIIFSSFVVYKTHSVQVESDGYDVVLLSQQSTVLCCAVTQPSHPFLPARATLKKSFLPKQCQIVLGVVQPQHDQQSWTSHTSMQ